MLAVRDMLLSEIFTETRPGQGIRLDIRVQVGAARRTLGRRRV
jgi:hypothetical protein